MASLSREEGRLLASVEALLKQDAQVTVHRHLFYDLALDAALSFCPAGRAGSAEALLKQDAQVTTHMSLPCTECFFEF